MLNHKPLNPFWDTAPTLKFFEKNAFFKPKIKS